MRQRLTERETQQDTERRNGRAGDMHRLDFSSSIVSIVRYIEQVRYRVCVCVPPSLFLSSTKAYLPWLYSSHRRLNCMYEDVLLLLLPVMLDFSFIYPKYFCHACRWLSSRMVAALSRDMFKAGSTAFKSSRSSS